MSLEQSDFNVTEGTDSTLPVNVVITNGSLERDVLVTLFTNNETATPGMHACVPWTEYLCMSVELLEVKSSS